MCGGGCPEKTAETRDGKRGRRDVRGVERSEIIFKEEDWSLPVLWTRCDLGDSNELARFALRVSSGEYGSKYKFYGSRRTQKERV